MRGKNEGNAMINFEIKGIPIPWKRPGRNNKTGAIYDDQKYLKEQIRWFLRSKYHEELLKGPVGIDFYFYLPMPKGASKPRKRDMLNGVIHHMRKPDVDNLSKFYLDVMTGVIYVDDGQVCEMGVKKLYATEPYTLIEITPKNCYMEKQEEIGECTDDENDPRNS